MTSSFPDRRTMVMDDITDVVGCTPCVRLNKVPKKYGVQCEVIAKCEFLNPGGSVKDRIGVRMVREAEAAGKIHKGDTLIEPTSGNTGIGISLAAAVKGYNMVVTMPQKMSHEKATVLAQLGAQIIRTPTSAAWDDPESLISVANRLVAEKGYVKLDQYVNSANPGAHYDGTGTEIVEQCGGKIDMVVIGAGTGGTMSGVAKKIKEAWPDCKVVAVDPRGSILADPTAPAENVSYHVEGIGYDFVPEVCHRHLVDQWVKSSDKESFELACAIHREEGMLVGGSSGSAMYGVIQAAKELRADQRCVVLFADNIRNYMSKFADRNWRIEHGFDQGEITRKTYGMLEKERDELAAKVAELEAKVAKQ